MRAERSFLLALILLLGGCATSGPEVRNLPDAPQEVQAAIAAHRRGDRGSAVTVLLARANSGGEPRVWDHLSRIAETPVERKSVLDALMAASSAPDSPRVLAVFVQRLRDDPLVREATLEALAPGLGDDAGYATAALAEIAMLRGNHKLALERLNLSVRQTPDAEATWMELAKAAIGARQYGDARSALQTYLTAVPEDPLAHYNLGWILFRHEGRPKDALPHLERAANLLPRDLASQIALGACALSTEEPDTATAERAFLAAERISPDDTDVHMNLGVLYADHRKDTPKAIHHFRRYLDLGGPGKERVERWIDELERRP